MAAKAEPSETHVAILVAGLRAEREDALDKLGKITALVTQAASFLAKAGKPPNAFLLELKAVLDAPGTSTRLHAEQRERVHQAELHRHDGLHHPDIRED
jgi:hypothetical protein